MFPELPQDLTALTNEELSELQAEFLEVARKIKAQDPDVLGTREPEEILAEMTAGVETIEEIKAELSARAEAEANFAASLEQLSSRVGIEGELANQDDEAPEDEPDADENGGDGEDEPADIEAKAEEAVVAAAVKPVRRPLPSSKRFKAKATQEQIGTPLVASTTVYPYAEPGEHLNLMRLSEVQTELVRKNRLSYGQKMIVASATYDFPDDRHLDKDGARNWQKLDNVTSPRALVASGGLCGPVENVYSMPDIETASRPVRDALANFRADRGGANIPTNPPLTTYEDAVGVVTAANDETGGTFALKNCMRIECPTFVETQVDSIYRCIEAGNLTARAYPELMARINTLVLANHARAADSLLLDTIKSGSTAVSTTNTANAGGVWEYFYQVIVAAAGMRSRNRMSDGAVIRALMPEWLVDFVLVDLVRGQYDRFQVRSAVSDYLRRAGVNPTFYKDGPSTGTGQVYAAQTAGALLAFPTDVQWALYPEGSWLHLDSGSLDLGIVRDSTLNSTNDFQIFAETWEQAALIGVESLWITSTVCPNGTVSAPKDLSGICSA